MPGTRVLEISVLLFLASKPEDEFTRKLLFAPGLGSLLNEGNNVLF